MKLGKETKTSRGFALLEFTDANGVECSLQTSSALDMQQDDSGDYPYGYHLWIGCDNPNPKIFTPGDGWQHYPLPKDVSCTTRMHLNRDQVRGLVDHLLTWLDNEETCFGGDE